MVSLFSFRKPLRVLNHEPVRSFSVICVWEGRGGIGGTLFYISAVTQTNGDAPLWFVAIFCFEKGLKFHYIRS